MVFLYLVAKVIKNCFKICQIPIFSTFWKLSKSAYFQSHALLTCVTYLIFSFSLIKSKVGIVYKYVSFRNLMNTFWRNSQQSMPIFHFFLCIFCKVQLDINNTGYHGNQMSFWNFKACFAVWGSYLLHTQRMSKIPDVACRTPMGIFWFLHRIHVNYHNVLK